MSMKMNNKGFTLVELLAVFVILISVSLVAVGGITASLDRREEREMEEIEELCVSASKIYFSLLDKGDSRTCVNVSELIDNDYFSATSRKKVENYSGYSVTLDKNQNKYIFSNSLC